MAEAPIHNILFDGPINNNQPINLGNNQIINNIESIYNVRLFKFFLQLYMGLLLLQYVLVYGCVPFDDIENRPSIMIISSLYCLFMFSINACILPICSSTIPTLTSFRCLLLSSMFEFIGLILNLLSVILGLGIKRMYSYEYDDEKKSTKKVDVTIYIKTTIIISFIVNTSAYIVSLINVILASHALKNLFNKIDRRLENFDDRLMSLDSELPRNLIIEQQKSFIP